MSGFYRAPITPGQTWFSPVGGGAVPANAGTIDTFLAGTTTAAPTYSDNIGTSNGVQIVLNSAGRLPNVDVWLPGGVAYKFVIQDSVGNPIATVDNITGENDPAFASGGFSQWISGPAATWLSAASFSCAGDQVSLGPLNRDRRIEITTGAGTTRATITSSIYASGTNLTTVIFAVDANDPAPTNPITNLRYGVLSVEGTSFPSAALELGAARRRTVGNTNTLLFGPIGSNMVPFLSPPEVVASAGGAGNQIVTGTVNTVAGSLTFNKTAHGMLTGQVVQLTTSNTLPGGTALVTDFIVLKVDANNFGLYAKPPGWQFEQPYLDPVTVPGGLTWGNPVVFSTAGMGNQTVTPGFEAPAGVTRVYVRGVGGGGGSGGVANSGAATGIASAGAGGAGYGEGFLTCTPGAFLPVVIGAGGLGGAAGNNTGNNGAPSTFNGASFGGGTLSTGNGATGLNIGNSVGGVTTGIAYAQTGQRGGFGFGSTAGARGRAGAGGGTPFGPGPDSLWSEGGSLVGRNGDVPGAGASGALSTAAGGAVAGADGFRGQIFINW